MSAPTRIAESITLVRAAGEHQFQVFIDGQEFPFLIDGVKGVATQVAVGQAPAVTFTVMAKQVRVDDQMLVGVDLGHESHDDEGADDARLDSERASQ